MKTDAVLSENWWWVFLLELSLILDFLGILSLSFKHAKFQFFSVDTRTSHVVYSHDLPTPVLLSPMYLWTQDTQQKNEQACGILW